MSMQPLQTSNRSLPWLERLRQIQMLHQVIEATRRYFQQGVGSDMNSQNW